jgi:hypothetical protein
VTHEEYNAAVQEMQRFCIAAGMEQRVRSEYGSEYQTPSTKEKISRTFFEVYWDGRWHKLGWEDGEFGSPDRRWSFNETAAVNIQAQVADAVSR